MRNLLGELCDDLDRQYRPAAMRLRLPLDFFRLVGASLKPEDYSGWKAVGWIEELNDLLYFVDLSEQLARERTPRAFAGQLFEECQEKFYENSYREELFPAGVPGSPGLQGRLSRLCRRLAGQVTQESLFLVPGLPCLWLAHRRLRTWTVPGRLGGSHERAELPGRLAVGLEGAYLEPPASLAPRLAGQSTRFIFTPQAIRARIGARTVPLLSHAEQWHWRRVPPVYVRQPGPSFPNGLTVGANLIYLQDLQPQRVAPTPAGLAKRIQTAVESLERAWPDGVRLFGLLTSRIVPLDAPGVVSFSYRHRPGLSFINTFERDSLDLIDDLVHENSHHQLNLLLRKFEMRRGDRNQEIFYSPWRRSLRPLHGILHATFTFTVGARLFERLASDRHLPVGHRLRARFRCLEEAASVGYSIADLSHAADRLGWLSHGGVALVRALRREISDVSRRMGPVRHAVLRSRFGAALRRHLGMLARARATYGLAGRRRR